LQMLMPVAALANKGIMCSPKIVRSIKKFEVKIKENIICDGKRVVSEETATELVRIMGKVVSRGTGKNAGLKSYETGGKTGTAQKMIAGQKNYSDKDFVMSFVGFAPLQNPKIALIIIFDGGNLNNESWGSTIAAPVWRRVVLRTLRYLRVPPDNAKIMKTKFRKEF